MTIAMNPRISRCSPLLSATLGAMLMLPACAPVIDTDMRDLKDWQAMVRKQLPAGESADASLHAALSADQQTGKKAGAKDRSQASRKTPGNRLIANRNPFASPLPEIAGTQSQTDATAIAIATAAAEPATLHLLGTIRDHGVAYALIEADRQVHCIALKASLPSYPITVARIAEHAVELDRLLPDGSHRRSTLRQGQ